MNYEPLVEAGRMLNHYDWSIKDRVCACYVLMGWKGDTKEKALKRIHQTIDAGFFPYAMLYKDEQGHEDRAWRQFQRTWCNPVITGAQVEKYLAEKGA